MKRSVARTLMVIVASTLIGAAVLSVPALAQPANDNFSAATALTATASGTQSGTNVDATLETDEPTFLIGLVTKTVWYSWTPPSGGVSNVNFCVYGSTLSDSTLAIFSGSAPPFSDLAEVASNDDGGFGMGLNSQVRFDAEDGTQYMIQVGGYDGQEGTFTLKWGSDCTAPQTSVTFKVKGPNVTFDFTGNDDVTATGDLVFFCGFGANIPASCTSPKTYSLASGTYTLHITAEDEAGNRDTAPTNTTFVIHSKKFDH